MSIGEIADRMSRGRKAPVSNELARQLLSQLRRRSYIFRKCTLVRLDDVTYPRESAEKRFHRQIGAVKLTVETRRA